MYSCGATCFVTWMKTLFLLLLLKTFLNQGKLMHQLVELKSEKAGKAGSVRTRAASDVTRMTDWVLWLTGATSYSQDPTEFQISGKWTWTWTLLVVVSCIWLYLSNVLLKPLPLFNFQPHYFSTLLSDLPVCLHSLFRDSLSIVSFCPQIFLSFALVLSLACFILTHCCAVIPGLESFSFDYVVKWPVSLILSKKVSTKWNGVLKCDVIILPIFPFEPLSLIMRYIQLL